MHANAFEAHRGGCTAIACSASAMPRPNAGTRSGPDATTGRPGGADGRGGTDLSFHDEGVPREHLAETLAGWVSVLMCLEAAVDHGVDLRNHDPRRSWSEGDVDN